MGYRRQPWESPQDIPPGPQVLAPRRANVNAVPGMGIAAQFLDVREINRYPLVTTLFFSLTTVNVPLLAVSQPDGLRVLLSIRNQAASAGNVFVAFGTAGGDANSMFMLVPGAQVFIDFTVPQDDVYISTDVAPTGVVIGYGNLTNQSF